MTNSVNRVVVKNCLFTLNIEKLRTVNYSPNSVYSLHIECLMLYQQFLFLSIFTTLTAQIQMCPTVPSSNSKHCLLFLHPFSLTSEVSSSR